LKHSSLLRKSVNYDHKKFYSTGPWCLFHKYFKLVTYGCGLKNAHKMLIKSATGQGSSWPRRLDGLDERREVLEAGAGQEPAEELRRQDGEDAAGSRI
jgi:hypothetical protein